MHGSFEFGKDFIAKRNTENGVVQSSFQTKGGDLGLTAWREARGQIDEMRTSNLGHPNFDTVLERETVFVTTGRLIGGASLSAQEYRRHLQEMGEGDFEVWDRETLIADLTRDPAVGLEGAADDALLQIAGACATSEIDFDSIEQFSRRWVGDRDAMWRSAAECAVVATRLRDADRVDLAALAALTLLRSALALLLDGPQDEEATRLSELASSLFSHYATELDGRCGEDLTIPDLFLGDHDFAIWLTYPVRCLRTAELLSLQAIRLASRDVEASQRLCQRIAQLVGSQPGAARPVSDGWAAALVPVGLVLAHADPTVFEQWARHVVKWVADHYQHGTGLAALGEGPLAEARHVMMRTDGSADRPSRSTSLIATALLDLVAVHELADLYDLVVNELLAVDVIPDVVEAPDDMGQLARDGTGVTRQVNFAHDETWTDGWPSAAHHRRAALYRLVAEGRGWEHLAMVSVLRDRFFVSTQRVIVEAGWSGGAEELPKG